MAVQGGLLTAMLAQQKDERIKEQLKQGNALPIVSFIFAKLIAYTILGFLLGWLGSFLKLSLQVQIILQLLVVVFMVGTALNLLNVHPIFRYFIIQPPRFLTRFIRKQSKRTYKGSVSQRVFAPALLGAFTIFIPCGTTQAMMALAVASGKPLLGAMILFIFVLGTSPTFFVLGYLTMKLGDVLKDRFMKTAAIAILLLALFNLDNAITLTGSPYTLKSVFRNVYCIVSYCNDSLAMSNDIPVKDSTITINASGYAPNYLAVKAGSEVKLHLVNKDGGGCTQAFTIPSLNLQKVVRPNTSDILTFTAPEKPGKISFMCSMGMYEGTINVI
jgi:sulfite exporter TauE/SafE